MNNNIGYYAFTGASGTGKSTLLNKISKWNNFKTIELSGRPYLPKTGDYIQNSSDIVQYRISYGHTVTMLDSMLDYPNKNLFFSRCIIDQLAYSRVLKVGKELHDIHIKQINQILPHINIFYIPIEFDLTDNDDEVRGNNQEIRIQTDKEIQNIIKSYKIPHTKVTGTVEERLQIIKSHIL